MNIDEASIASRASIEKRSLSLSLCVSLFSNNHIMMALISPRRFRFQRTVTKTIDRLFFSGGRGQHIPRQELARLL